LVNDFEDAELVIGAIWGDEKLDLSIHKDLCDGLFNYLEIIIEKMHSNMNPSVWSRNKAQPKLFLAENPKGVQICETPEQLIENIQKVLRILGMHISFNPNVFFRVIAMTNHYLVNNDNLKVEAFKMTGEYFLPALCIVRDNNEVLKEMLDHELWAILSKIDFKSRYFFY
jgi:hypothetical protein